MYFEQSLQKHRILAENRARIFQHKPQVLHELRTLCARLELVAQLGQHSGRGLVREALRRRRHNLLPMLDCPEALHCMHDGLVHVDGRKSVFDAGDFVARARLVPG